MVNKNKNKFRQDMVLLIKKYGIPTKGFLIICNTCGSPLVKMHLWNPTAFTRACEDCGYKELYNIHNVVDRSLQDLQGKGLT